MKKKKTLSHVFSYFAIGPLSYDVCNITYFFSHFQIFSRKKNIYVVFIYDEPLYYDTPVKHMTYFAL